jgi:mannose/fructose-specific phosphotransferase system component IIA
MSEAQSVRGIVVGHGEMPRGILDAVRRIAGGAADALVAVSNNGKGPDQLKRDLDEAAGAGPAIVFVDLQSGSCGAAAFNTCRECATRVIVSGVNLPMLLDFVFHRDLPLEELVGRLVEKGRDAIRTTAAGA